ncbi:MAG: hypothetical protein QME85_05885 [Candidatus Saccharicenans sp.]|nr:hypothetical protein [Candidatus Saccharicenans sp.]MDI6848204.1 hypothetical protein [Candidatus Saccharicenans sp.]
MTERGGKMPAGKRSLILLGLALSLLALAASIGFYFGYRNYYRYQEDRGKIRSLERDFPALEVRLKTAVRYYRLPVFYAELGRLRLQRAMAEIEFGQAEQSEPFLDEAREALRRAAAGNPVDYSFFWELSKVYFLYNYPLLTYAENGRLLCREALRRHPYNEFLFLNIALVFFEQWPLLEPSEKEWLQQNLDRITAADPGFLDKLKRRWRQSYKETGSLESRLAELGRLN